MRNHGYQNYFDNEVMAASPLKLIEMLYAAALETIAEARRNVRRGDIRARTRAINKALRIVTELSGTLNHEAGGDVSRNLAGLYAYILKLLIEANLKQNEAPLAEADGLISTLAEGWKACTAEMPEPGFSSGELLRPDTYAVRDLSSAAR